MAELSARMNELADELERRRDAGEKLVSRLQAVRCSCGKVSNEVVMFPGRTAVVCGSCGAKLAIVVRQVVGEPMAPLFSVEVEGEGT